MNALVSWYTGDPVCLWLLDTLILVTIFTTLGLLQSSLLARKAALRCTLCSATLLLVVLAPLLPFASARLPWHVALLEAPVELPEARTMALEHLVRIEPNVPSAVAEDRPAENVKAGAPPTPAKPNLDGETHGKFASTAQVQWPWRAGVVLFLGIWAIGSIVLTIRLAYGLATLRWIRSRLRPLQRSGALDTELASRPKLWSSADVHWPMLLGVIRPRIVLPTTLAESCTTRELRAIVLHENAHLVRGDAWICLCQRLAGIVFWIHPLVRLLNQRLDQAREEVCDNHVLSAMPSADYAEVLLRIAQTYRPGPGLIGALSIMPRHPALANRVASLLDERRDLALRVPTRQRVWLALGMASLLIMATYGGLQSSGSAMRAQIADGTNVPESVRQQSVPPSDQKPGPGRASGSVAGVVQGADGRPASGADVWLISADRTDANFEQARRQTKSTAKGEFIFEGVEEGHYWATAFKDNLTSRTRRQFGSSPQIAPSKEPKPVILKLQPGMSVTAKVLSQEDGNPIRNAVVHLGFSDGPLDFATNASGEAVIQGLTPEDWRLEAFAPGRATKSVRIDFSKQQAAVHEFSLAPGGSIEGRVVDERGNPVSDVHVMVPQGEEHPFQSFTGPDGRYRIDHLPLSTSLRLIGQKTAFKQTSMTFRIPPTNREMRGMEVAINRLPVGGSVRGVVTDSSGKPMPGAEILNPGSSTRELRKTTTDSQGTFVFDNVETDFRDLYHLVVLAKGFAPLVKDIQPGSTTKPSEVTLRLESGHRILGRVVDQEGKPIANVAVFCANQELRRPMEMIHTTTNAQGHFELDSMPADAFLGFGAQGFATIQRRPIPTDRPEEVVVVLRRHAVIVGRVVDSATGKPIPQFIVRLNPAADAKPGEVPERFGDFRQPNGQRFNSTSGEFDLKNLEAGTAWQLNIQAEGYQRQVLRHAVAAAAPPAMPLEIRLVPEDAKSRITIAGKLVDHKGDPLAGANLMLIASRDRPLNRRNQDYGWDAIESGRIRQVPTVVQAAETTSGADGSFNLPGIPADGELELVYWGAGFPRGRKERLERLSEAARASMVIKAFAPSQLTITIDRKVFPDASRLSFGAIGMTAESPIPLAPEQSTVTLKDLGPGSYSVAIHRKRSSQIANGNVENRIGIDILARKQVIIKEGHDEAVSLGKANRFEPPARRDKAGASDRSGKKGNN